MPFIPAAASCGVLRFKIKKIDEAKAAEAEAKKAREEAGEGA